MDNLEVIIKKIEEYLKVCGEDEVFEKTDLQFLVAILDKLKELRRVENG